MKNRESKFTGKLPLVMVVIMLINIIAPSIIYADELKEEVNVEELEDVEDVEEVEELEEVEDVEEVEEVEEVEDVEEVENKESRYGKLSMQTDNSKYVLAKDSDFSGSSNGNFRYIGTDEYVEIPHVIKGVKVTSYANMFRRLGQGVRGVKSTNKNITNMGSMFYEFKGSSTLDVSELDTSNVRWVGHMFSASIHGESNITTLIGVESFDTSKVESFNNMFHRSRLTRLDLTNFNTDRAINMERMFYDSYIRDIGDVKFRTPRVTNMRNMFRSSRLSKIDLTNFETTRVDKMEGMFANSSATEIVGVENIKTANITNMEYMFEGVSVRSLDLGGFDTSNVRVMKGMFKNARLEKINIENFDTSNVEDMGEMFESSRATEIVLGDFKTKKVESMNSMFKGSWANSLDLTSFDTRNVTDMIYMFQNSKAKTIKTGGNFNTGKVEKMTEMFKNTQVERFDFSNFDTRNVVDIDSMFESSSMKSIDLTTFNTQRVTDMSKLFKNTKATSIKVPNFNTEFVLSMDSMFEGVKIDNLDISSFEIQGVNSIDDMFKGSEIKNLKVRSQEDLIKVEQSKGVPKNINKETLYELAEDEDFSGMLNGEFRYIGGSKYVEIPKEIKGIRINTYKNMFESTSVEGVMSKDKNIKSMEGMFKNTTSEELDLNNLETSKVENMVSMFEDSNLISIGLGNFKVEKVKNMERMFKGVNVEELDLGSFNIGDNIKVDSMFKSAKITKGYGRTSKDTRILNSSSNKPSNVIFKVWGINTKQNTDEWTNKEIGLEIQAHSEEYNIDYVEMVNEEGRNYLLRSANFNGLTSNNGSTHPFSRGEDNGVNWVYGRNVRNNKYQLSLYAYPSYSAGRGSAYSEDFYPVPRKVTYSLDVMSKVSMRVRFRGGTLQTLEPNKWTRISTSTSSYPDRPGGIDVPESSEIPLGTKLYYKNYKIEIGDKATPWKPAPEDRGASEGQEDTFKIYSNGTHVFRATDTKGNIKTVSHTVTNIDMTQPTAKITPSTTGWTSSDVDLYVKAGDDLSGVESITLPNGNIVSKEEVTYTVKENGTYKFIIKDKAGNETIYEEKVSNIDKSRPELSVKLDNTGWTRGNVGIKVTTGGSESGLASITSKDKNLIEGSLVGNTKSYTAKENGLYTFEAKYNNNTTSEVSINVTNIDREPPTIGVENNPTDWTEEDEISLGISVKDRQSGLASITLPNGEVIKNKGDISYKVSKNGTYVFRAIDKVGNKVTEIVTVDRLMVNYSFHVKDENNKPLKGVKYALKRNGETFRTATSNDNGLVNFGKVPPTWDFTIKVIGMPNGMKINPEEVKVDQNNPKDTRLNPRGDKLPSTGTYDMLVIFVVLTLMAVSLVVIKNKKKQ